MIRTSVTEKVFPCATLTQYISICLYSVYNSTVQYLVQDGEGGLGVPVRGVGHPAAGLGENRIIVII